MYSLLPLNKLSTRPFVTTEGAVPAKHLRLLFFSVFKFMPVELELFCRQNSGLVL